MSSTTFQNLIAAGSTSKAEALRFFDRLSPVDTGFMLGNWKGSEFPTGHRLDGMLEAYHWHGKRFRSETDVDPLIFRKANGKLIAVNPKGVLSGVPFAGRVPLLKSALAGRLFQQALPYVATRRPQAKLRMVEFRGQKSAAMVYNDLPITDSFRQIDANTVLGCMDMKGMREPYFFVLRRE